MRSAYSKARGVAPYEAVPVEFGQWLPDIMALNSSGATEVLNVIPIEVGYAPYKDLYNISNLVLPSECRGAIAVRSRYEATQVYAATVSDIYFRIGGAFTSLYHTAPDLLPTYLWQFVQFGSYLVALHPQVKPQVTSTDGSAPFALLGGAPPRAACGARVGDFLVLGNLDDETDPDGARQPARIRWSGFNNIESDWITSAETQADFQDMPTEGGAVTSIIGREFGTVFQERSISRMTYVGLPDVFEIETVEKSRGALSVGCVIDIGGQAFFIAEDGFFMWNGVNATPIGNDRVNRYFFNRLNYQERGRIVGAVDWENGCVRWAFPVGSGTALEETIVYSYRSNRWSHADKVVEYIFTTYALAISIDDLTGNLDTDYPITFDSTAFQDGKGALAGFDSTHSYGMFAGPAMAAVIETADADGPGGTRIQAISARPIVDLVTASATVAVGARDQLIGEALVYDAAVAQEITGECPILSEGRYLRFRVAIAAGADWRHAFGIEITRRATGKV